MAVFLQFINVLVPVSVLEARYPGGLDAYRGDCPNRTFCCDGRLTRVGFMSPVDVEQFVIGLESKGLEPMEGDAWKEVAIVAAPTLFPTARCSWIAAGRTVQGADFACLRDDVGDPGKIHVPGRSDSGWVLRDNYSFSPFSGAEDDLRILRSEDGIDICLDSVSGTEIPVRKFARYLVALENRRRRAIRRTSPDQTATLPGGDGSAENGPADFSGTAH